MNTPTLLALRETLAATEAYYNRLSEEQAASRGRRVNDPYARHELKRLQQVIANARQVIDELEREAA